VIPPNYFLHADAAPVIAALTELESLLARFPDAFDEFRNLVKGGLKAIIRTEYSPATSAYVTICLHPSDRFLAFLAAIRAGKREFKIVHISVPFRGARPHPWVRKRRSAHGPSVWMSLAPGIARKAERLSHNSTLAERGPMPHSMRMFR